MEECGLSMVPATDLKRHPLSPDQYLVSRFPATYYNQTLSSNFFADPLASRQSGGGWCRNRIMPPTIPTSGDFIFACRHHPTHPCQQRSFAYAPPQPEVLLELHGSWIVWGVNEYPIWCCHERANIWWYHSGSISTLHQATVNRLLEMTESLTVNMEAACCYQLLPRQVFSHLTQVGALYL